jgi:hypothetical protein
MKRQRNSICYDFRRHGFTTESLIPNLLSNLADPIKWKLHSHPELRCETIETDLPKIKWYEPKQIADRKTPMHHFGPVQTVSAAEAPLPPPQDVSFETDTPSKLDTFEFSEL